MRVLDLFAGARGASWGYLLGGASEVVGVDFVKRRDQPADSRLSFIRSDVREVWTDTAFLRSFDLIHASPPCKENTRLGHLRDAQGGKAVHADMLDETRAVLDASGVPYVLENVPGAAMRADVTLCGSMFSELGVYDETGRRWLRRHRLFELGGWGMFGIGIQPAWCCTCQTSCSKPMCGHRRAGIRPLGIYGSAGESIPDGGQTGTLEQARALLGMPWANWEGCTQAIPPAYTAYLMRCFVAELSAEAALV